jgi:uroporphyrinogen-III synthase
LVEDRIGNVKHTERNAKKLAEYLTEYIDGTEVTYFCSDLRLDDLTTILTENNITINEIVAYKTKYASVKIDEKAEGVMFYSPSTIKSYLKENDPDKIAFCIGETTAKEAKKYFKDVRIAKLPTVESVIELVNHHYI